ncbi:MAG: CHASE2 domain-containing protein [Rhodocyclaceae bacterium]|nr:CHASE2 domain-containing protein [Rhodocyclaceae bacterium]
MKQTTRPFHCTSLLYVAAILLALSVAVSASGALARLGNLIYDLGQRISAPGIAPEIVVVGIDHDSLTAIGRWPWPREVHAQFLAALCSHAPAAVGLDIAFVEPDRGKAADAALADAIGKCGKVVLPVIYDRVSRPGDHAAAGPVPALAGAAAGIGRVNLDLDIDGIARSFTVGAPFAHPLFAEELLRVAAIAPAPPPAYAPRSRFPYAGPARTFPQLSYADVLQGRAPAAALAGKIVLVGATAVGIGDVLATPVSTAEPMPGVEIQANILNALRQGRLIEHAPAGTVIAVNALLSLLPLLWLPRLAPLTGLLASLAWMSLLGLGAALWPLLARQWIEPGGAILAALLAYPLWSWLQLEFAHRHLSDEIERLSRHLPQASTDRKARGRVRGILQKIGWVQTAQARLQALEAQRNEALAFISHDLRLPIANVLQQLREAPGNEPQVRQLQRAHDMAQSFLSLSRAEALESGRMQEMDLVAVLYQAVDQMFAPAQSRGITLRRRLPDEPVWIVGDFGLLERVVLNLLHNAISLSPGASEIEVGLEAGAESVEFWVKDQGPGLGEAEIARLFQRFGNSAAAARHESTGLGLYLVRTVAEKHGGRVGVESAPGHGARFWVSLPTANPG